MKSELTTGDPGAETLAIILRQLPTYTFKQKNLLTSQDFSPPPDGYLLLSAEASTTFKFAQSFLKFTLKAENLLNTRYRDYLNRLRYFADESGRNTIVQVNYTF